MPELRPIRDTPANRRQLGVITKSTLFRRRQKLIALFEYLVGETMAGREVDLTQQKIAADAFNAANPDDAQAGVTVRTAAARLRTALDEYYRTQAAPSEIRITMPPRRFYIAAESPEQKGGASGKGPPFLKSNHMPKLTAETMKKLDDLVEEIEAMEPTLDCEAYCKRELLGALDRAHELLASLVADAEFAPRVEKQP